ncbi:hypothetical protein N0V93_004456 [Gnomoniopsis smithogilvyi]|uniref:STAS domain-containing protein n=1 Tax=Gnomoniopsis smithogilvyi TaxID=1191159 RepID=A0A9W9CVV4_9PEZI|nr:hypothetical protein N0V93_004456 [Gnomoniopsis smithogilvyi]
MEKLKGKINGVKVFFRTDWNVVRAKRLVKRGFRGAPRGAARYFTNKVPFVDWIAIYNFRWLPFDALSGITVGIVLALQAVNVAVPIPGGITVQQTLLASWLPGFIYAITGTSKNISIGPTSSSVLLSLQLVGAISAAARIPAQIVLPALTLAVSIWFLIFGLLGLGFLFDLIPVFLSIAIVTALAIIVTTLQLPFLLGLIGIPNVFVAVLPAVIQSISNVSGRTVAISASGLIFLGTLTFFKNKWGKEKSTRGLLARYGVAGGSLIAIVLFAAVSSVFLRDLPLQQQVAPFIPPLPPGAAPGAQPLPAAQAAVGNATSGVVMINPMLQGPATRLVRRQQTGATTPAAAAPAGAGAPPVVIKLPFWPAFPEFNTPIPEAQPPVLKLATSLFFPSFVVFMVINIEHLVVARFFAHQHEYTISKSQEMVSLGLINLVNSFFGGVPVGGGDMTRSSILAYTGSKSPLNQIFTSATVLVVMLPLSEALRFLPQAVLAVITLVAVVDQQPPQALISTFFKLSFADFLAFFLAMNIAIPTPTPINAVAGVALGVGFMVIYTLLRIMFKGPKVVTSEDLEMLYSNKYEGSWMEGDKVPPSTLIMKPDGDIIFTNSERLRRRIMDTAYLKNSGKVVDAIDEPEKPWNFHADSYISSVRRRNGAEDSSSLVFRPRLRMVILDMSSTTFMDTSALMSLELMKKQMRDWAGETLELRFVGLNKHLKRRFERAKWRIVDPFGPRVDYENDDSAVRDLMFDSLPEALRYVSQDVAMNGTFEDIVGMAMEINEKKYVS